MAIEIVYVYDECYNCINDIGIYTRACMGINHAYIIASCDKNSISMNILECS